jgi:sialate O-acetylesterase
MRSLLLAAVAALTFATSARAQAPVLDAMFQDHAVLQRDRPAPVWGRAAPGASVAVSLGDVRAQAVAGADGTWRADLPAMPAGGPYVLTASAGEATQSVSDVMVGDVWLCSGQSNMEYQLRQVTNADIEVANARDDGLRLFLVGRSSLPAPSTSTAPVGQWRLTTPDSARDFSAACYFMGRDLRKAQNVPVGLIAASWGGSIIEDWVGRETLVELGGADKALEALAAYARSPEEGETLWNETTSAWWRDNDPGAQQGWNREGFDDSRWSPIPAEGAWEATVPALLGFDGLVWMRTEVQLTAAQARQAATIELGPVDDVDTTWVNGRHVGGGQGWDTPRVYALPQGTLGAGRNVVAVGVLDTNGGGGAWGPASSKRIVFADGSTVPLSSGWRYRVSAQVADLQSLPRTPWVGGSGLTTLYNGMILPLGPYGLKGAAWYQGESNAGDAPGYARLLPALFADWRARFQNPDLRMLVVQLANFGPASTQPTDSLWAALRESQRRTVAGDPLAGLAVAIDIGDRYDIHPTNKQEVGRRLALEALRLDGLSTASSPQPIAVERAADGVHVRYAPGSGLILYGFDRPVGFELCDAEGACRFVDATLAGDKVILPSARPTDVKVRLCWAESPICNLYGPPDLPATPFEALIG